LVVIGIGIGIQDRIFRLFTIAREGRKVCQQNYIKTPTDLAEIFREGQICPVYSWLDDFGVNGAATWRTQRKNWHSVGRGLRCPSALL